jgi:hypothetical protein
VVAVFSASDPVNRFFVAKTRHFAQTQKTKKTKTKINKYLRPKQATWSRELFGKFSEKIAIFPVRKPGNRHDLGRIWGQIFLAFFC